MTVMTKIYTNQTKTGEIQNNEATCFPGLRSKLSPKVKYVKTRVCRDGNLVTSEGPGTGMEYPVVLVEALYGKEKANEVARSLVLPPNQGEEYTVTDINPLNWTLNHTPQVLVPIANGIEEIEASAIIDILRRATAKVVVASVEDKLEILASQNVKLIADMLLDEAAEQPYDLIVLPGGLQGVRTFANSKKLVDLLKKQAESNKPYGAICASPFAVPEPHGLPKETKAAAHPVTMCNNLFDKFEHRVLIDGNVITSRGSGTAMEFSFGIVEKFFGRDKAMEIAKGIIFVDH